MLLSISAALCVIVLADVRHHEWDDIVARRARLVQALTGLVAAAIAGGTAFWLHHLATGPDHYALAYLLTGAIFLGGVTYLAGTLVVSARALELRRIGWILMTAPLLVPSTFSLFLPVVAALAVTVRPLLPPTCPNRPRFRKVANPSR